jgi:hypothetical protein
VGVTVIVGVGVIVLDGVGVGVNVDDGVIEGVTDGVGVGSMTSNDNPIGKSSSCGINAALIISSLARWAASHSNPMRNA